MPRQVQHIIMCGVAAVSLDPGSEAVSIQARELIQKMAWIWIYLAPITPHSCSGCPARDSMIVNWWFSSPLPAREGRVRIQISPYYFSLTPLEARSMSISDPEPVFVVNLRMMTTGSIIEGGKYFSSYLNELPSSRQRFSINQLPIYLPKFLQTLFCRLTPE